MKTKKEINKEFSKEYHRFPIVAEIVYAEIFEKLKLGRDMSNVEREVVLEEMERQEPPAKIEPGYYKIKYKFK